MGSHVDELTITPAVCAPFVVDPVELHEKARRLAVLAQQTRAKVEVLRGVDQILFDAGGVPGGAVSAAPARAVLGAGVYRLQGLIYEIEQLADSLTTAAQRYEDAEFSILQSFHSGVSAGFQWWQETVGFGPFLPFDLFFAVPNRFLTAASEAYIEQYTEHSLHDLPTPRQRIAALFSGGVISYNEMRRLTPIGWLRRLPDVAIVASSLPQALSPIWASDSPGIDRRQGALFARALSRVIASGGDVGSGAAVAARAVDGVHAVFGHQRISMERIAPKHRDKDPARSPVRTFGASIAVMKELEVGSGTSPGEIRIDKVTSAEGEDSWQVFIPGGQGFDPGNVHSLLHTVSSVDSNPTPSAAMVTAALRDVGVKKGEPIVMVGHSHGGITASMLANDPRVRAEFDIPLVITAGSPVDRHDIRPDTHVVSFEHTEDFVTGLDGVDWQAKPGMTRVERTLAESQDSEIADGVGVHHSHDYPNYIDTAELADQHEDLEYARSRLAAIIPEGEVDTFRYRAEITP